MQKTGKMGRIHALTAAAFISAASLPAAAQQQEPGAALLVADRVFVEADRRLVAEGNVEAFHQRTRLQAARVVFDRESDTLTIEGPIRIDEGTGTTVYADFAELDRSLQDGLLTGARLVLQQQMQIAALRMNRVEGRYSQLYKTALTSCQVCDDGRPPIWQIRAQKIIHDQLEKQIYLEGAQLRVLDVPVFYFPAFRLPDPSLKRSNGFLVPKVRSTSNLGVGLQVPYFITLGDHRDLTLTPYLSGKTSTLGARYRQAFRNGRIEVEGAYTRDDLLPGESRGYLFADGLFELQGGFNLEFGVQLTSDDAYLADYGLPDQDRLRSELTLTKVQRDRIFRAGGFHFKSLRPDEDDSEQPNLVGDVFYQQRYHPPGSPGEYRFSFHSHAHYRSSNEGGAAADPNGRDVIRNTADAEWVHRQIFSSGLVADWEAGASVDVFNLKDEAFYEDQVTRFTPRAAMTLRRPMTRIEQSGARQMLEPILQAGWSNVSGGDLPIEESRSQEFDQGNLLAMSRFPAPDAREDGARLVYGLNWALHQSDGTKFAATAAQVLREEAHPGFTDSSGLGGTTSDFLLAGQLQLVSGIGLTARGLLDSSANFSKAEFRGDWKDERTSLSSSYLWLEADPAEGRGNRTSELWFDGSYQIDPNWSANANVRYDLFESDPSRAGLGFVYTNECVKVDLAVNRRYTSNSSVEPSTDFSFSIALGGFLADTGTQNYRRSCKNT